MNVEMKGINDPVTKADKDSEIMIDSTLLKMFPGLAVVGEETIELDEATVHSGVSIDIVSEDIIPEALR
jgi:fructose-1,6-bisphosphatase/inositol monophosphatase family enzyme